MDIQHVSVDIQHVSVDIQHVSDIVIFELIFLRDTWFCLNIKQTKIFLYLSLEYFDSYWFTKLKLFTKLKFWKTNSESYNYLSFPASKSSNETSNTCCVCRYTTCVPRYTTVSVDIQHVFVRTQDVVVDTQQNQLCLWIYRLCLCINNFNLIGWIKLVVYTTLLLCKQHQMLCKLCLQLPMILESFLSY